MAHVVIRTADGQLVSGELVLELPALAPWQHAHIHEIAARWDREAADRAAFRSLAHLLLWWDQLHLDIPAIEWHLRNLGIEPQPGTYAGPGPWAARLDPGVLDSGIAWRTL